MAGGAVPTGPMDGELTPCPTNSKAGTLPGGASTRWIVLVGITTAAVLDLTGVLQLPTDSLLELLLFVL